jgi:hypothetical protein
MLISTPLLCLHIPAKVRKEGRILALWKRKAYDRVASNEPQMSMELAVETTSPSCSLVHKAPVSVPVLKPLVHTDTHLDQAFGCTLIHCD